MDPEGSGLLVHTLPRLATGEKGLILARQVGLLGEGGGSMLNELLMNESGLEVLKCMTRSVAGCD